MKKLNWFFSPVAGAPGPAETDTLYILSLEPPTYGPANAKDGVPPWDSRHPGGSSVPVPSPEPSDAALILAGVAALIVAGRYRFGPRPASD